MNTETYLVFLHVFDTGRIMIGKKVLTENWFQCLNISKSYFSNVTERGINGAVDFATYCQIPTYWSTL